MRVITADGEYIGVLNKKEALEEAKKRKLDLVEISPNAEPPVCKIIDHGKYKYRQKKKEQKKSQKSHQPELKTVKISFSISDHDMEVRVDNAEKFLSRGDRVRVVLPLRGRENALQKTAREKMKKFLAMVEDRITVEVEKDIEKEPRGLTMTLTKN